MVPSTRSDTAVAVSPAQRVILKDQGYFPNSPLYNVGGGALLDGWIDLALFSKALQAVTAESEALRLVISSDGSQRLVDHHKPVMLHKDFSGAPDPDRAADEFMKADFANTLALNGISPPWYVALIKVAENRYWLHLHFHHAMMDGYGSAVVMQRWAEHYNALLEGRALNKQHTTVWQQHLLDTQKYEQSETFLRDEAFWKEQLQTRPDKLFNVKNIEPLPAESNSLKIKRERYEAWDKAGRAFKGSAFHIILASVALYYARISDNRSVVIGVPVLNRIGRPQRSIPGMFTQVLPLVIDLPEGATSSQLISEVVNRLRQAARHQRYPLDQLYDRLNAEQQSHRGTFDIILSFMRQKYEVSLGDTPLLRSRQHFASQSRFPLSLTLCEFDSTEDIVFVSKFYPGVIEQGRSSGISERFLEIADRLSEPEQPLCDIPLMTQREWLDTVLSQYTPESHPAIEKTVLHHFLQHLKSTPNRIAVRQKDQAISYAELAQRAATIADAIGQSETAANNIVGLACERSFDFVAAVLGCMMARAAFFPLDIDLPDQRLSDLLHEVRPRLVLADALQLARFQGMAKTQGLDQLDETAVAHKILPPSLDDLAYLLTTSGSTGKPKTVMVTHRALAARIEGICQQWNIGPEDSTYQSLRLTFDPALADLFLPLTAGGCIVLSSSARTSPSTMLKELRAHQVSILISTPSLLESLATELERAATPLSLKLCTSGGEVLSSQLMMRLRTVLGPNLVNAYGPTEAIIFATRWPTNPEASSPLPIGRPLKNSSALVLSKAGVPLPPYETGEICIGGQAIATGYLGNTELTASKFREDPIAVRLLGDTRARYYRTGDLGWLDETGLLHFVGRTDRQLKIRGYRVEPEEIETALLRSDGVACAAVKLGADSAGTDRKETGRLHAFIEPFAGVQLSEGAVSDQLRATLPDYMWPSSITIIEKMPRTPVGKIDIKALTPRGTPAKNSLQAEMDTPLAGEVRRIWSTVLGVPVALEDDFFLLGGDSFAAVQMLCDISVLLGQEVSFSLLLSSSTLQQFIEMLEQNFGDTPVQLRLNTGSSNISLHIVASGYGDLLRMRELAKALPEVTLSFLQPPNGDEPDILQLAELYADAVQTERGERCFVAGFSIGGVTALETARILHNRGFKDTGIILIDSLHPGGQPMLLKAWRIFGAISSRLGLQAITLSGRKLNMMFSDRALNLQIRAASQHQIKPITQPVTLLQGSGVALLKLAFKPLWKRVLTGSTKTYHLPGFHGGIFNRENRDQLAKVLRTIFDSNH